MGIGVWIYNKLRSLIGGHGIGMLPGIRQLNSAVIKTLRASSVRVMGHTVHLDPKDSMMLSVNKEYGPFQWEVMRKQLKKGNVAADIGANIGYFSLLFAREVGENGKVHAFEPDPLNASLLKKNVSANYYRNIAVVEKAASDKTGTGKLYLSPETTGDHRIFDSHDKRKSVRIGMIRMDDYFRGPKGKVDFVKMDVQGAEGHVLKGMANVLKNNPHIRLVFEFWPAGLEKCETSPKLMLESLRKKGFILYEIKDETETVEKTDIKTLLEKYTSLKDNHTNLLCVRKRNL